MGGARLRRRFTAQGQWRRHQCLRLRVGLDNLSHLDSRIQDALRDPFYEKLAKGPGSERAMQGRFDLLENQADPTPAGIYGFTQRAILEYLVADAVSRQASSVQLLADQLTAMVERGGSLNVLRFSLQLFERRYEHYRVLGEELMTRLTSANILATSERLEAVSIVEGFLRETDPPAIYADSSKESL